jgi:HK97 family phage portal protein
VNGPDDYRRLAGDGRVQRAMQLLGEARSSLENPSTSLTDPNALALLGLGEGAQGSGITVSPQTALGVTAVYAAVFYRAKTFAWLPCHVMRKAGRVTETDTKLPASKLLSGRPNAYQTRFNWRMAMDAQMMLWGNGYSEIQRDVRTGEPIGLWPLPAWAVETRLKNGVKTFHIGSVVLPDADVFHIMAPGFDGIRGLSPIRQHRMTVGMALEAVAFGEQFYKNGTRLAGALEHPNTLSDEAAARLRTSWTATYSGKANAGKVAILEEGMKFNPFTMPMEDAQYVETRKFSVGDIARIYGVPPHKIGDLEKATFSNIEHQAIEAVNDCHMPDLVQFEEEANAKLLTDRDRDQGFTARHNVKALLRGDIKGQMEALKMGREAGFYSVNDGREFLDLNPVDGPGGDERIRPLNFVPIGTIATPQGNDQSEGS